MRYILTLMLLGVGALSALAESPKVVVVAKPDAKDKWQEVKADRGRMITLSAEPASKWLLVDEADVDMRATDSGKYADFVSPIEGRFKILVTSPAGETTKVVIIVGDSPPTPPTPPNPPPVDALKKKLQDAFSGDTNADKVSQVQDLTELYKQLAKLAQDESYVKASDLLSKSHEVANTLIGPDALIDVRTVVKAELSKIFPVDVILTKTQRDAATGLFDKLATLLQEITEGK